MKTTVMYVILLCYLINVKLDNTTSKHNNWSSHLSPLHFLYCSDFNIVRGLQELDIVLRVMTCTSLPQIVQYNKNLNVALRLKASTVTLEL